jgi:hypothetical protein
MGLGGSIVHFPGKSILKARDHNLVETYDLKRPAVLIDGNAVLIGEAYPGRGPELVSDF